MRLQGWEGGRRGLTNGRTLSLPSSARLGLTWVLRAEPTPRTHRRPCGDSSTSSSRATRCLHEGPPAHPSEKLKRTQRQSTAAWTATSSAPAWRPAASGSSAAGQQLLLFRTARRYVNSQGASLNVTMIRSPRGSAHGSPALRESCDSITVPGIAALWRPRVAA